MDILAEIYQAVLETHPNDLHTVKIYIAWVGFRRRVHDGFYLQVHWIKSSGTRATTPRAHWVR